MRQMRNVFATNTTVDPEGLGLRQQASMERERIHPKAEDLLSMNATEKDEFLL